MLTKSLITPLPDEHLLRGISEANVNCVNNIEVHV